MRDENDALVILRFYTTLRRNIRCFWRYFSVNKNVISTLFSWVQRYKPPVVNHFVNPNVSLSSDYMSVIFRAHHNAYYTMSITLITNHPLCHLTNRTTEKWIKSRYLYLLVVSLFFINCLKLSKDITKCNYVLLIEWKSRWHLNKQHGMDV